MKWICTVKLNSVYHSVLIVLKWKKSIAVLLYIALIESLKVRKSYPKKAHPLIVQILGPLLLSRFIWSPWLTCNNARPQVLGSVKGKHSPHWGFSELRTGPAFPRLLLNICSYHVQVLSENTYAKSKKIPFFFCVFVSLSLFSIFFLLVWFSFLQGQG